MTDITSPRLFVGIQPCRLLDTRGAPIGGGTFTASESRTYTVTGSCGIPAGADAVSLNFSVVSPAGTPLGAFLLAYPTGQPPPPTAVMTFGPGATIISNAAIIALNGSGQLTVNVSHATHVIMDVNGYFSDTLQTPQNYLELTNNSGGYTAFLQNQSTTCSGACGILQFVSSGYAGYFQSLESNGDTNVGVYGSVASSGGSSAGLQGQALNSVGLTYGVRGSTSSADAGSAAVFGTVGTYAGGIDPDGYKRAAFKAVSGDGNGLNAFVSGFSTGVSAHGVTAAGVNLNNDAYLAWNEFFTFGLLTNGNVNIGGNLFVSGTKSFVQPHPTDASKQIKYISVEAPAAEIYYRGTAQIQRGITRVEVPESFRVVASPGSYATIVTPVGAMATVAVMQEDENGIVIQASRDVKVHYVVHALRAGFENEQAIEPNILFQPGFGERYFQGLPAYHRSLLVRNHTLNTDGTPNRETAERLNWKLPPERTTTPE